MSRIGLEGRSTRYRAGEERKRESFGNNGHGSISCFALDPDSLTDTPVSYQKRMAAVAGKYLEQVKNAAAAAGGTCDLISLEHKQPYQAIIDTAKKNGCDLIVMVSHGRRGLSALVLGSETVKVLTHSAIPVLVYR
jgi:nucleotide-binding universal stress UspA family protein